MAWVAMRQKKKGTIGCETGHYEDGMYLEIVSSAEHHTHGYCVRLGNV